MPAQALAPLRQLAADEDEAKGNVEERESKDGGPALLDGVDATPADETEEQLLGSFIPVS